MGKTASYVNWIKPCFPFIYKIQNNIQYIATVIWWIVNYTDIFVIDLKDFNCMRWLPTLCPKSPSARGLVACLPVRLLFKSTKHNVFYPV